jgi:hypothetical protein
VAQALARSIHTMFGFVKRLAMRAFSIVGRTIARVASRIMHTVRRATTYVARLVSVAARALARATRAVARLIAGVITPLWRGAVAMARRVLAVAGQAMQSIARVIARPLTAIARTARRGSVRAAMAAGRLMARWRARSWRWARSAEAGARTRWRRVVPVIRQARGVLHTSIADARTSARRWARAVRRSGAARQANDDRTDEISRDSSP